MQIKVEIHGSISVSRIDEAFDQALGNGLRFSGARQQTLDTESSIYAPPTVTRQIKNCEQITRE